MLFVNAEDFQEECSGEIGSAKVTQGPVISSITCLCIEQLKIMDEL